MSRRKESSHEEMDTQTKHKHQKESSQMDDKISLNSRETADIHSHTKNVSW